jgi:hypothetical protein
MTISRGPMSPQEVQRAIEEAAAAAIAKAKKPEPKPKPKEGSNGDHLQGR